MTTTQITSFDYTIPVEYFINDEVCDAINDELPEGVALACNGMLFAEVEVADVARELDLREILEDLDIEAIIRRHEI